MIVKKFISVSVALSLTACAATVATVSQNEKAPTTQHHPIVAPVKQVVAETNKRITLEKIMSDPDWIGRSPQSWYWGDDSNTVFFKQKQEGNPLRDLFRVSLKDNDITYVEMAELHTVDDRFAIRNKAGTKEVYTFNGNVFVKSLADGTVTQLTYTSDSESSPMFLNNGDVAYRVKDKFFRHSLTNNQIIELASLIMQSDPKEQKAEPSYLAQQQTELIDYIALTQRNRGLIEGQSSRLKAQNATITQSEFYLGKGKRVVHASLSPAGDKLIVSVASGKSSRKATDIMPNYIQEDGNIKAEKVRHRVADNRQYSEELYLLDLTSGMSFPLGYQALPGADEDVLAQVKEENYARLGKRYESENKLRNIHVMRTADPIKWQADGKQVAVMLEAWDNKDRWLASVNLLENKLESQHRLHDPAWVNYTFNEFGWLGEQSTLYYLSEESGYSHLYVKSLKGKSKQLTDGMFEVSNVTLSNDEQRFFFKANKSHPGIYEVYSVDLASLDVQQHTQLSGMTDYALSPNNSKLLLSHSSIARPSELYIKVIASDQPAYPITDTISAEFKTMPWAVPQIVAIASSHQQAPIYARVYLPEGYKSAKDKLPAVMFSHGAGYLQNAHMGWSGYFREYMFHSMLVQQGYVVIDMDYRASKGYGRDWRTAIYRHMGKPEVQDMLDGVNWLVNNANVDANRVGTYGGSYGGFLTLMALFTEPQVFQSGAALRLVSDWAYYNHGYTANILNTPEDDAIAYERSSPIYFAEGLTKPLLINAPMVDDNVFFQDTVRLVQRLIELEKTDFETAIYPVEPHGFVQPSSWLDEYRRIYKLFEQTLN